MAGPERLRVVHLIPSLGFGGLEQMATLLTLELATRVERIVVCTAGGLPEHHEPFDAAAIPVVRVPRPWPRPLPLARAAAALAPVLRRERPHLVHAHNPGPAAAAAAARLLSGRRRTAIVTTYHAGLVKRDVRLAALVLRLTSDRVVGVGESTTARLVGGGLPAARASTIPNGVALRSTGAREAIRRELGADGRPLVVTVGRHVLEKNQALLVEAARILRDEGRPPRVAIVGEGRLEQELRRQIAAARLEDVCVLVPARPDVQDVIAAADAFALPSLSEGLPLVVLEAMLLGTPVVATDVGSVGDVVRDGETGLLVPPGDAAGLAAALRRLLDDPGLGAALAARAQADARERFTAAAMADAYLAVYREAVSRRSGASPS